MSKLSDISKWKEPLPSRWNARVLGQKELRESVDPDTSGLVLRLQQGRCAACGLYLKDEDLLELDHIIPKRLGGTDTRTNLQVLHRHCHDRKTAQDDSGGERSGQPS